ncbi:MAG: PTS sugar transporter subunit IIA [Candidatus Bathyarchaeota archaeon]|nr:PTS sugar transporter subunit IIA [Candidatus Bathyarchaeota archaeon]
MPQTIDVKILKVESEKRPEILKEMGDYLYDSGYTKETFTNAVIEREKKYPTGLEIPSAVNVALPHADIEHVKKQALLIAVPNGPVKFKRMDAPDKDVNVELILLPVIKNPEGYVKFLSKLTLFIQKKEFLELVRGKKYSAIAAAIREECLEPLMRNPT